MIHRHAEPDLPLFARPPDPPPKSSGAPRLGRNGANADEKVQIGHTRLPLIPPAGRNAPPGTSDLASTRIRGAAPALRDRVLAHIDSRGSGCSTDEEGEAVLAMRHQTYSARRRELVMLGMVQDSGQRRPTTSGRPAAVWTALPSAGLSIPTNPPGERRR
jgi:hypothetical protein